MAYETDGGKGKAELKGPEQGQQIERALVAPDGTITISKSGANLTSVDVADVDLLLTFSDGTFVVIPNGALDAVSETPPTVLFDGNKDSLGTLFKKVGTSTQAKAGSLRVVSGNVDAPKTQIEEDVPKTQGVEHDMPSEVPVADASIAPAPLVRVSSGSPLASRAPGASAAGGQLSDTAEPMQPPAVPRSTDYRDGQKTESPEPPSISLTRDITADDIINISESHGTVAITGTVGGSAKAGSTVTLTVNGIDFTGLVATDFTFSIEIAGSKLVTGSDLVVSSDLAADPDHIITASITTPLGTATDTEGYYVDIIPPAAPAIALVNDSGSSNSDKITNFGTVNVTGVETGATVEYSTDGGTTWTPGFTAVEGSNTVSVRQTDSAGNIGSAGNLSFILDTTPPVTPIVALSIDSSDGIAGHNSDLRTSSAALAISAPVEPVIREYSVDGGSWSTTYIPPGVDGSHTVNVRDTDLAGNTATGTLAFVLDTTAPVTPTVALNIDSSDGISGHNNDHITNNKTLVISAAVEPVIREYSIDGGSWNTTYTATGVDGSHSVSVRDTDVAGNVSNVSSLTFIIDTTAPVAPIVALNIDSSDGLPGHTTDLRTSNAALTITAPAEPVIREYSVDGGTWSTTYAAPVVDGSHTVTVRDTDIAGNTATGSLAFILDTELTVPSVALSNDSTDGGSGHNSDHVTSNAAITISAPDELVTREYSIDGGIWSAAYSAPVADGNHTVSVRDTDVVGNSATGSLGFTLDTTAVAPVTALTSDNGSSNSDKVTNIGTLIVSGGETGALVEYSTDGGTSWNSGFTAVEGSNTVTVRQTDIAGNTSAAGNSLTFTLDTSSPLVPSVTLATDTSDGVSGHDSDLKTSSAALTVSAAGEPVIREYSIDGGSWNTSYSAPSADGLHTVSMRDTDVAGNSATGTLQFTLDTTAPVRPMVTAISSDTLTIGDHKTSDTTLIFSGTAETNSIVEVFVNGVIAGAPITADAAGVWNFDYTGTTLQVGSTYTVTAQATDAAGNTSVLSSPYTVTIDMVPPVPTIFLDGNIAGDGIVNSAEAAGTVAITGTAGGDAKAGDRITLTVNGVDSTGLVQADNTFSINVSGSDLAFDSDKVIDASITTVGPGVPGTAVDAKSYSVDTTAPLLSVTIVEGALTTGTNSSVVTFSFSESPVDFSIGDIVTVGGTISALAQDLVGDPSGKTYSAVFLANDGFTGTGSVTVTSGSYTDASLNVGVPGSDAVAIDTVKPSLTIHILDSNLSDGDSSSVVNLTFSEAPVGFDVGDISVTNGTISNLAQIDATHYQATFTALDGFEGTGSVSIDATRFTDAALNDNVTANTDTVNIDTKNPSVSVGQSFNYTENQAIGAVVAIVATSYDTSVTDFQITGGTGAGYYSIDNSGQITLTSAAANNYEGTNSFTLNIQASDAAGNTTTQSVTLNVTNVDEAAPVVPAGQVYSYAENQAIGAVVATVAASDDIGVTGYRFNTTGTDTSADGYYSVNSYGQISITAIGAASAVSNDYETLPNSLTYGIEARDAVGNWSAPQIISLNVIDVDEIATAASIIGAADNVDPVQGNVLSGGYTNDTTPTLSGTAEANSIVTIYDGATMVGTVAADVSGAWSYTPAALADGTSHSFTVTATDAAGNVSAPSAAYALNIDATVPLAPSITGADDNVNPVTGNVVSGGYSNDTTPTLSGTAEANSIVSIYDGGVLSGTVTADGSGIWSYTTAPLTPGTVHSFTVTAMDSAGNVSAASAAYDLHIQTTLPTPSISGVADDVNPVIGTVASGGSTNDTTPTLSGTAEANSSVSIYDAAVLAGTVTADGSGAWSYTPAALGNGTNHSFTVTATDAAGNVSAVSAAYTLTVDTTAQTPAITGAADDVDPSQGNVASGGSTNDTTPTLSGLAEANSTVTVFDGAVQVGSVTADGSGVWSYTSAPLGNGTNHSFTVTAMDAAGNVSAASSAYTLTIDTAAPAAPGISGAADDVDPVQGSVPSGGYTNDTTPTLSGTAEANSIVTVFDGAAQVGIVTTDGSGVWNYTPSALGNGTSHSFTASATDAAGNVSTISTAYALNIDTAAPAAPVISSVADDVDPVQGGVANGGSTNDTAPTLSGTAEANSTVSIYDGAALSGIVTADGSGAWSYTPAALGNGTNHSFTVTATDAAGNVSAASSAFALTVDTAAPAAPVISGAADDVDPVQGSVASGGYTNDTAPTLSGTAEANSIVTVFDGATQIGIATADGSGVWSYTPAALGNGTSHSYTVTATDAAGNVSASSSVYTLNVDTTIAAPGISGASDNVNPVSGNVPSGGFSNDPTPTLSGTAEANSSVSIYDGAAQVGTVTADGSGVWSYTPATDLGNGTNHGFTVIATDAAGNVSAASSVYTLNIDTAVPAAPTISNAADNVDPVQGPVASGGSSNDPTPTLSGTAEANSSVSIYDGAALAGTVTADGSGVWSYTPAAALGNGNHSFTVTATDAAGNVSAASSAYALNIDTAAAAAPTISSAADNVDPVQGPVANGGYTNDTTPTFTGTAEANSSVSIYNGAVLSGTATADGSGAWSFTPAPLAAGTNYSFTATATDAAGNVSAASTAYDLHIRTTLPTPSISGAADNVNPVAGNVASGGFTNDTTPTLSGTAQANSTVSIFDGAALSGTVTADGSGAWSYTPAAALGDNATHSFTVTATDAAGNVSAASSAYTLYIDAAIAPPSINNAADDVSPVAGNVASGGFTNDTTPTLSGTAEANSTVTVFDGAAQVGIVTADGSGVWSYTPATALGSGSHSFTVTAADAAGNVNTSLSAYVLNIDTAAAAAPTISNAADNVDPAQGAVASGGFTNDTTPTLSGTAEADSTVSIYDGAVLAGTVMADGGGAWSYTPTALGNGTSHSFTATATDAAGNVSAASSVYTLNIDTAIATPGISGAADNVNPVQGNVLSGGYTNDSTPTLSGTAEANSTVSVYDGAVLAGTAAVNGSGVWSYAMAALGNGTSHSFTVTATDAAGNVSAVSTAYTLNIDTAAPSAPTVIGAADNVNPVSGNVPSGGFTNDTTPTLSGTAEANRTVSVFVGAIRVAILTADSGGAWSYTPGTALINGTSHNFTAIVTDAANNVSASSAVYTLNIDTTIATPGITGAVDDVAPVLGNVASGGYSNDTTPTLSGTAEANSTVAVFDGAVQMGTATANGSGVWNYTPVTDLGSGSHSFTVIATDSAGNVSAPSSAYTLNIDIAAPAVPGISGASDNVNPVSGNVPSGGFSNDPTPTLSGTAEANSTVSVYDGAVLAGTATADGSGVWSYTPAAALGNGGHSFTVTASDVAGNVSTASSPYTLTIDTAAPLAPSITGAADNVDPVQATVANGGYTNDPTPTLSGTAEADSVVTVFDGAAQVGTVTANGSGAWSYTPAANLGNGTSHGFTVTATDAAGNISAASPSYTLNIDATAPDALGLSLDTDSGDNSTGTYSASGVEAGATVEYSTTGADGSWSTTPPGVSAAGDYRVYAHQVDRAGNVSSSTLLEFTCGSGAADTLTGDGGANIIIGRSGDDILSGLGGDDTLYGDAGKDILDGNGGTNVLYGGDGDDTFNGGAGIDSTFGGGGADTVSYSSSVAAVTASLALGTGTVGDATGDFYSGVENLIGGGGNDQLTGDGGANILKGGDGSDTLIGGAGADSLYGGDGITDTSTSDTVSYEGSATDVVASLLIGTGTGGDATGDTFSGIENLTGGVGNDTLSGDAGINILKGGLGNDTLRGNGGNDIIYADQGNDYAYGGGGDDTIHASSAAGNLPTQIDGGSGSDTVVLQGLVSGSYTMSALAIATTETVDIRDGVGTDINISAEDIQNMVGNDIASELYIKVDAGDSLSISLSGTQAYSVTPDGTHTDYAIFTDNTHATQIALIHWQTA